MGVLVNGQETQTQYNELLPHPLRDGLSLTE